MKVKNLYVIRHAQAVQDDYHRDFDRSLTKKAIGQIIEMSAILKNAEVVPDLVLVSAALRTKQTAEGFATNVGFSKDKIELKENLYNTTVHTLIQEINKVSDDIDTLFLIGHNPSVGMLVDELVGEFGHHFSTAAIAFLQFEIEYWAEVSSNTANLLWLKETQNN